MATVTVSLPAYLQQFIDTEIAARGHLTRGEFIEKLVLKAYLEKHQDEIEPLLLEGLQGPMTPMTKEDWVDIRSRIRERLAKEKKAKRKRA